MTTEIEQALVEAWPKEVVSRHIPLDMSQCVAKRDVEYNRWWEAYWSADAVTRETMLAQRRREQDRQPRYRCAQCGEYTCHIKHGPAPRKNIEGEMGAVICAALLADEN